MTLAVADGVPEEPFNFFFEGCDGSDGDGEALRFFERPGGMGWQKLQIDYLENGKHLQHPTLRLSSPSLPRLHG